MKIEQAPRYLAVHGKNNTNYYRITVEGKASLGNAEFRSGWYPADAVNSLFGDISKEGSIEVLKAREDIKAAINEHYLAAIKAYLAAAQNPNTSESELEKLLKAQKRILSVPGSGTPSLTGSVVMEYDPRKELLLRHSDDKLVFILSNDPTATIEAITNFAEHQKTSVQVTRLAEVLNQQSVNQVASMEAKNEALQKTDKLVINKIEQLEKTVENTDVAKEHVVQDLESLLIMLESVK